MKKIQITRAGYNGLVEEKKVLEDKRVAAVSELSEARDMGDRSENAYYKTARQKLSGIDRRLREINRMLREAVIVDHKQSDSVDIGSKVELEQNGNAVSYTIVGPVESNLNMGLISCLSPLGKVLMGRRAGDTIDLVLPIGKQRIRIKSVR